MYERERTDLGDVGEFDRSHGVCIFRQILNKDRKKYNIRFTTVIRFIISSRYSTRIGFITSKMTLLQVKVRSCPYYPYLDSDPIFINFALTPSQWT